MNLIIKENETMSMESSVKLPKTIEQAIRLSGLSRHRLEKNIHEHGYCPVNNGDYWYILEEKER